MSYINKRMRITKLKMYHPSGIIEATVKNPKHNDECVFDFIPYPVVMVIKKLAEDALERRKDEALKTIAEAIKEKSAVDI